MNEFQILIAEDHALYRDGLRLMASELFPGIKVFEADSFDKVLEIIGQSSHLDLLLLDIQMPGTKGLEGIVHLKKSYPLLPIVVISSLDMGANIRAVMELGVSGFIAKSTARKQMLESLRRVIDGEVICIGEPANHDFGRLSPRQLETLALVAEGQSNKEIAKTLNISDITVREYVSEVMRKLNANNRMQAVATAIKTGILID
jgi:DNA-binding NarL/FixJ family response regulator